MCYGGLTFGVLRMNEIERTEQGLNTEILHDLLSRGVPRKDVAIELGISKHKLNKLITELEDGSNILLRYRELQNLQLTSIQAKILDAITPEKIEAASLGELTAAFRILKDKENCDIGKPTEIKGLVGYLIEMEKQEFTKSNPLTEVRDIEDYLEEDDLPKL